MTLSPRHPAPTRPNPLTRHLGVAHAPSPSRSVVCACCPVPMTALRRSTPSFSMPATIAAVERLDRGYRADETLPDDVRGPPAAVPDHGRASAPTER